jgi:hypothetical protein
MPRPRTSFLAGLLFIIGLTLTSLACASLFSTVPGVVPTIAPPTPTAPPTNTALPLYEQVAVQTISMEDQGQSSAYTITAQFPKLVGSDDPRVQSFNADMKAMVDVAIAVFKQNLAALTPTPNSVASTFDLRYNVLSPPGNILSIKFDIQTYYSGAAHPGEVSQTATYDLGGGKQLGLEDLFLPDVDYLGVLSKFCVTQLGTRDIGFQGFELGATATLQNYRNWNITPNGLMISFDEYQVAPYAAGPQTVVIPYSELASIILPDGPLAGLAR